MPYKNSIFYRIGQFQRAKNAKLSKKSLEFVRGKLGHAEQILFFRMDIIDQVHSINVAKKLIKTDPKNINKKLIEIALLHDVGKSLGRLKISDRVIWVLLNAVSENLANKIAEKGRSSSIRLFKSLWVLKYHALLSAKLLKKKGMDQVVVYIVAKHHEAPKQDDPIELFRLRVADSSS
jgi:putative nucleotidyltransferase with HDIG domain